MAKSFGGRFTNEPTQLYDNDSGPKLLKSYKIKVNNYIIIK